MRAILLAACVLAVPSSALAEPAIAGLTAERCASRFSQEPRRLCLAALGGDAAAQRAFARALIEGAGIPRDEHAAEVILRRAAEAGHAGAAGDLARMVETRDPAAAERWYRRAAEGGDLVAAWRLAVLLHAHSTAQALEVLRPAYARAEPLARQGDLDALFLTGAALVGEPTAIVVELDGREGIARLRRAADGGHVLAASVLGQFRVQGPQRFVDLREARRYLAFAAERRDRDACRLLAHLILGTGGANAAREHLSTLHLLRCAADQGSADSAYDLASIHAGRSIFLGSDSVTFAYGPLLRPDLAEARRWYARAAEMGHPSGRYELALMLMRGEGGAADREAALAAVRATIASRAEAVNLRNLAREILETADPGRTALELAREAVEAAMARRDAHLWVDTLALVHLRLGDAVRAEELLRAEIARRGDPDNIDVVPYRMALGDALAAQGRVAGARAEWERVIPQVRGYLPEADVRRRLAETAPR